MSGRGFGTGRLVRQPTADGGHVWVGTWTDSHCRRHRRILSSDRRVAERALVEHVRRRDLEVAGIENQEGQSRPLADVVQLYLADLATYRSAGYVRRLGYCLDALMEEFGNVRVRDVTVPRMQQRRTKRLAQGAANKTINVEAGALRGCFNWAVACGHISVNPIARLRKLPETEATMTKVRRALSDEEIGRLLRAAQNDDAERAALFAAERSIADGMKGAPYAGRERLVPIPQAVLWKTFLATGLRYGEAATLRWADVDLDGGAITVRATVAKSRRARQVPAPDYLVADLRALIQIQTFAFGRAPGLGDRVFLSPRHRPLDPSGKNARLILFRILERASIDYKDENGAVVVDIHALRGTCATRLLRNNVPLAAVSEVLGHSDVRLTMRHYADLRIADTKKAVAGVPEIAAEAPTASVRRA